MVVSMANSNKQFDADILQCKADIRSASPIPIESIPSKKTAFLPTTEQEKTVIPSFDLAEEIMAEQRKITAIRRKAPGKKIEAQKEKPEAEPTDYTIEQPMPAQSDQEQIITEIVARDIERLCRGDTSGAQGQAFAPYSTGCLTAGTGQANQI